MVDANRQGSIHAASFLLARDGIDIRTLAPDVEENKPRRFVEDAAERLEDHFLTWGLVKVYRLQDRKSPPMSALTGATYRRDMPKTPSDAIACFCDIEKALTTTSAPTLLKMLLSFQYVEPHIKPEPKIERSVHAFVQLHVLGAVLPEGPRQGFGNILAPEWQHTAMVKTIEGMRRRFCRFCYEFLFSEGE